MQDFVQESKQKTGFGIENLSPEERGRLVCVFAWLLEEDKKQNPAAYQLNNSQND